MKNLILLFFITVFTIGVQAQNNVPAAETVMARAFASAKASQKKVLLIFHASWCGWCHKMDTALNDAACKNIFERNFVITHLTVKEAKDKKHLENSGAAAMYKQYAGSEQGIPVWVILNSEGKTLATSIMDNGENSGCPATEAEVNYFVGRLKQTTSLNAQELKIIFDRFRKNELPHQ